MNGPIQPSGRVAIGRCTASQEVGFSVNREKFPWYARKALELFDRIANGEISPIEVEEESRKLEHGQGRLI